MWDSVNYGKLNTLLKAHLKEQLADLPLDTEQESNRYLVALYRAYLHCARECVQPPARMKRFMKRMPGIVEKKLLKKQYLVGKTTKASQAPRRADAEG